MARGEAISAARTGSGGDAGHGLPLRHGVEAMKMGGKGGATGTGRDEEIADGGEDGDEPLQACRRSKALHRPLASSQRQVRVLGPVVEALLCERCSIAGMIWRRAAA